MPPVVTASAPITVEPVNASATPATNPMIQAFLAGATANDEVDGPLTSINDAPANFPVGVTTVTFSATDAAGNTGTATSFVVVYDPDGGFVTGGGFIDSPAGAYPADPNLAGKANFGFASKYKKGTTIPTGNTQFQFTAAGFQFHSSEYEWLVVA